MRTVLIIEDDHDTRVALREGFEAGGFCVFTTANGRDGLDVLPSLAQPLVVLLDQNMPVMSGDEFLRRKLQDERVAAVPVIVISAVCDRTHGLANAFVSKPLDIDSLLRMVASYFPKDSGAPPAGSPVGGGALFLDSPKPPARNLCLDLLVDTGLLPCLLRRRGSFSAI